MEAEVKNYKKKMFVIIEGKVYNISEAKKHNQILDIIKNGISRKITTIRRISRESKSYNSYVTKLVKELEGINLVKKINDEDYGKGYILTTK